MILSRVARKRKARLARAVRDKPAQRPERLWACEGAAGILRLCPRMQNLRLRRGIMIHGMEMCSRMDAVEKEKFPRKQMELQRMQLHRSLSKTPGESSKGLQFSQTTIESGAMHTLFFRANMAAVGKARFPVHGAFQSGIMRSGMFAGRTWRPVIPWCKCRENPRARNQRKCALRMVPILDADRSEDPPGNKA